MYVNPNNPVVRTAGTTPRSPVPQQTSPSFTASGPVDAFVPSGAPRFGGNDGSVASIVSNIGALPLDKAKAQVHPSTAYGLSALF